MGRPGCRTIPGVEAGGVKTDGVGAGSGAGGLGRIIGSGMEGW